MLRIRIIAVGKKHQPELVDAIKLYEKRLSRHCKLTWDIILPSDKITESTRILQQMQTGCNVLLDETGQDITNKQFSALLERARIQSQKELVFIIGGAFGVTDTLKQRADMVVSLSSLVFPHQMVRLILTEQLYRGFDALAGGKYHHE